MPSSAASCQMVTSTLDVQVRLPREDQMSEAKGKKDPKWIHKARYWIAAKPSKPGVWRIKGGGFLVRGRATDPRTGKQKEVIKPLDVADAATAYEWLQRELARIRS